MDLSSVSWTVPLTVALFFGGLALVLRRGWFDLSKQGLRAGSAPAAPKPLLDKEDARIMFDYILRAYEHFKALDEIQRDCLTNMMRAYEEAETHTTAAFKRGFKQVLDNSKCTVEESRRESRAYIHMVTTILTGIKDEIRKWFRSNHYYGKSEQDWDKYKKLKRETLEHMFSDEIDHEWISEKIDREALRQVGSEQVDSFDVVFEELFNSARAISIRAYEAEQEEKARWSADVRLLTGHDPYDRHSC